MEWPSSRVDGWALALFGAGWAALALPESITVHPVWIAVICWVGSVLLFVCGFPAVQGWLRTVQSKFLTFCERKAVSYPFGAPLVGALIVIVIVGLLFGGGWWLFGRTLEPKISGLQPPLSNKIKREAFIQALRLAGPSTVIIECIADKDSRLFCANLYDLVRKAQWTIRSTPTSVGESWTGVQVVVKDQQAPPRGATEIVAQLKFNGILARLVENPNDSDLVTALFAVRVGYLYNDK